MHRIHPKSGEIFLPHRFPDGYFRVADPKLGNTKHHAANQISVTTTKELAAAVSKGFHVRMRGQTTGQVNLVRPEEISFDDAKGMENPTEENTPPIDQKSEPAGSPIPLAYTPKPDNIPDDTGLLPKHGRLDCSKCFDNSSPILWGQSETSNGEWAIANNPMAWGSQTPKYLVLGFSKGGNQNKSILTRPHDDVAFAGGRRNLAIILETLGIKDPTVPIDHFIADKDGDFAFGSFIRCSVKKYAGGKWLMSGKDIMKSCLKDRRMGAVIDNCAATYLSNLPESVKLVIMLGNDKDYIEGCYAAIRKVRPGLNRLNAVAYGDEQVKFIHTVHFKAQGNLVPNWAHGAPGHASSDDRDQPLKRSLAQSVV